MMHRRHFIISATAGLSTAAALGSRGRNEAQPKKTISAAPSSVQKGAAMPKMPTIFLAHGGPNTIDDELWAGQQLRWAQTLTRPTAIVMISAHWEARPATLGATQEVPLVYDFYGFPQRYYQVQYRAPGAPTLAAHIKRLAANAKIAVSHDETRGLDHGAYIPLIAMYPKADIPVLQLSLPSLDGKELFALGQALQPLREEGVLVIGSGHLTHNLRAMSYGPTPSWALEFDAWIAGVLQSGDVDQLIDFKHKAPALSMAHPTVEHFVPLIVNAGLAGDSVKAPETKIDGWIFGSLSKRSVQFG